jgi:aminoglycoside phosphotransferase (APT) family kinase protein
MAREGSDNSSLHGFGLSAEDERLLRGPVPDRALTWAAAAIGPTAAVVSCQALAGGTSSAVHGVTVTDGQHRLHRLVLRRFVRLDWLAEEPDLAIHEATALATVARSPLSTPRAVACDPDGVTAGAPAILMTRLEGKIIWDPPALDAFLRLLAKTLALIHSIPVPAGTSLPPYRPYPARSQRPPVWAGQPEVWERAIELLRGPVPSAERKLIHRDYHPGNVLWNDGRVSGVIDWVNTSIGSPWADVGHCRANIAGRCGLRAADRFLALYREVSGRGDEYHPYWDMELLIGSLDERADETPDPLGERFLAAAVARL